MNQMNVNFLLSRKEAIRGLTLDVAGVMPAEQGEYRPYPESLTFAQLLLHAVTFEARVCSRLSTGEWSKVNYAAEPLPLPEAIALVKKLTAEHLDCLKQLAPEKWAESIELPWGGAAPAFAIVNATNEHEIHHRGQMYVHLRLNGITPPHYR